MTDFFFNFAKSKFLRKKKSVILSSLTPILLLCGCGSEEQRDTLSVHEICGRDLAHTSIYRVKAPDNWVVKQPSYEEGLEDTKKALCEFYIQDESNEIRITIHNFPSNNLNERIPPSLQIMRWKRQFDYLDPATVNIIPQSFAGYVGAFFEAMGEINGVETGILSFSMQLSPKHYQTLSMYQEDQKKADFTIKATGLSALIEKHRKAILAFARTFELIDEIGYP